MNKNSKKLMVYSDKYVNKNIYIFLKFESSDTIVYNASKCKTHL